MPHSAFRDDGITVVGDAVIPHSLILGGRTNTRQINTQPLGQERQQLPCREGWAVKLKAVFRIQLDVVFDRNRATAIANDASIKGAAVKAIAVQFYDLIQKSVVHIFRHASLLRGWFAKAAIADGGADDKPLKTGLYCSSVDPRKTKLATTVRKGKC